MLRCETNRARRWERRRTRSGSDRPAFMGPVARATVPGRPCQWPLTSFIYVFLPSPMEFPENPSPPAI